MASLRALDAAPAASRSSESICRHLVEADAQRCAPQLLATCLDAPRMLLRLQLNVRYYKQRDGGEGGGEQAAKEESAHIASIAALLDVPYEKTLELISMYLKIDLSEEHTTSEFQPDTILKFYLHERVHILYLLSLLLQAAGDANSPYCVVARKVIPRIDDLFENVLKSYVELSEADVPSALNYENGTIWADNFVQEQAMLLQVIVSYFFAFKESPSAAQAQSVLRVCQTTQFGGRPVIYTMLSSDGREAVKSVGALWNQILTVVTQIPKLTQLVHQRSPSVEYPDLAIGDAAAHVELDERWFSGLGDMEEHGPALLAWSVCLCLSYQVLEQSSSSLNTPDLVSDLQKRLLARLSTSLRINALGTIASMIRCLDHQPLLDRASLFARDTYKELLFGMCICNVYNVVAKIPSVHESLLFPLYAMLLQHSPELCNEMWQRIQECIEDGVDLRAFPTFAASYQQFVSGLPISNTTIGSLVMLIELLTAMSSSRSCAEYAMRTLQTAASDETLRLEDGLRNLRQAYTYLVQQIAISQTLPTQDQWRFIAAMTKFLHRCADMCQMDLPDNLVDTAFVLLRILAEASSSWSSSSPEDLSEIVYSCLGIIHRGRLDRPEFASVMVQYSLDNVAPRILHDIDIPSGLFRGVVQIIRLLRNILDRIPNHQAFSEPSFRATFAKTIDFVVNDVLLVYDTWKYAERLGRFELQQEIFHLFKTLLCCPSIGKPDSLMSHVGRGLAIQILNQSPLQKAVIRPLIADRPFLQFGHSHSVRQAASFSTRLAFHVLDKLLELRFDWSGDDSPVSDIDDSLFSTFFSSGIETSRMLREILSYMDVSDRAMHALVVNTLTQLCNLSSLLPDCYGTSYSLAGYLGVVKVDHLRRKCSRLLKRDLPFSHQSSVIDLLCAALRYQAGLAETLFGFAPKKGELTEHSVWHQLKKLLIESTDPIAVEQLLKVMMTLWEAAASYRNIAGIIDVVVKWDELWVTLSRCLLWPSLSQSSDNANALASLKAQAWALRVITCELRYTDGKSSSLKVSNALSQVLKVDIVGNWLDNMVSLSSSSDGSVARAHLVAQFKLFMEAILLFSPESVLEAPELLRFLLSRLGHLAQRDDLPLAVISDFVSSLLPLVRFAIVQKVQFEAQTLLENITNALTSNDVWYSKQQLFQEDECILQMRCQILEKLLMSSILLLSGMDASSLAISACVSKLFRVSCRFVTSESLACLPALLLEHIRSARDFVEPLCDPALTASPQSANSNCSPLALMLRSLEDDSERVRARSVLRFALRVCQVPHGAAMLVREGLVGAINNSFLRTCDLSTVDVSGKRSERHILWCLTLDVIVALLRSFGDQNAFGFEDDLEIDFDIDANSSDALIQDQLLREIGEFLVVFRRQICVGLRTTSASGRLHLSEPSLEEMQRLCSLLYEVSRVASRWRLVPLDLLQEHKQLVRFVAISYSKLLADAPRMEVCARERVLDASNALQDSTLQSFSSSRLLVPFEDPTQVSSSVHLKRLELGMCQLLCSVFSFLRVFTPDSQSSGVSIRDLMFSCDVTYRSCGDDYYRNETPPMTFLVETIDYCLVKLSHNVRKGAGLDPASQQFIESHSEEFDRVHRFLFENSMYMLLAFARVHLADLSSVAANVLQDFVDVFERLRRSSESLSSSIGANGTGDFIVEWLLEPLRELEQRLVKTLRMTSNAARNRSIY